MKMRKPSKWQGAKQASADFEKLVPGGYIATIMNAEEYGNNCLKISYDIADGQFKGYFANQYDRWGGTWRGTQYQAVEARNGDVLASFSNFIYCVEDSNRGYVWNWDERTLKGLRVGIVLREEEWINNDGEVRTSLKVSDWKTVSDIKDGNFTVRAPKKAEAKQNKKSHTSRTSTFDISDNDIQF